MLFLQLEIVFLHRLDVLSEGKEVVRECEVEVDFRRGYVLRSGRQDLLLLLQLADLRRGVPFELVEVRFD